MLEDETKVKMLTNVVPLCCCWNGLEEPKGWMATEAEGNRVKHLKGGFRDGLTSNGRDGEEDKGGLVHVSVEMRRGRVGDCAGDLQFDFCTSPPSVVFALFC